MVITSNVYAENYKKAILDKNIDRALYNEIFLKMYEFMYSYTLRSYMYDIVNDL